MKLVKRGVCVDAKKIDQIIQQVKIDQNINFTVNKKDTDDGKDDVALITSKVASIDYDQQP